MSSRANRPGRSGLHERPGRTKANLHLCDAPRGVFGLIVLGMLLIKGFLDALCRTFDGDGRSADDSPGSRRDRVDTDAGVKSHFLSHNETFSLIESTAEASRSCWVIPWCKVGFEPVVGDRYFLGQ